MSLSRPGAYRSAVGQPTGPDVKLAPYASLVVRVGDVEVGARYVSPGQLLFVMPPRAPSDVDVGIDVQVSLNGGVDFGTSRLALHVHAVPTVSRIWPVSGPAWKGAALVTAYGSGFLNTEPLSCLFGDTRVAAAWVSSTELSCRSPPGRAGLLQFEVSNNAMEYSHSGLQFLRQYVATSPGARGGGGGARGWARRVGRVWRAARGL